MGSQTNKIIAKMNRVTEKGAIGLALDIHGGLTEDTPVDTGWARANWIPSVGTPAPQAAGAPGQPDTGAVTQGIAEVSRWKISDGPIYLTNNVPYIQRLNAGGSNQAPAGFIEANVQTATNRANRRGSR